MPVTLRRFYDLFALEELTTEFEKVTGENVGSYARKRGTPLLGVARTDEFTAAIAGCGSTRRWALGGRRWAC